MTLGVTAKKLMKSFVTLNVILLFVVLLTVNMQAVIMLSGIRLKFIKTSVDVMSIVVSNAVAPCPQLNRYVHTAGTDKLVAEMSESSKVLDLMKEVELRTGVPMSGQKLILNGKSLTSLDRDKTLAELHFKDGSKVMVLGKKFDPQSDELYKAIVAVQQKSIDLGKKLAEV